MPQLELITLPEPEPAKEMLLTEEDIRYLLDIKVLTEQVYCYFAIRLSYPNQEKPNIDCNWFSGYWGIKEADLNIYLARLQKKGAWYCHGQRFVQLELFRTKIEPDED